MGFTFNGIHSNTMGITAQVLSNPMPNVKTLSYSPQWVDGTIDYSSMNGRQYYEDKIIEIKLQFKVSGFSELYEKFNKIIMWFKSSGELVLDSRPNVIYDAKVQQGSEFVPQYFGNYGELIVNFRTAPFARGAIELTQDALEANIAKSFTIDNPGYYSEPEITVTSQGGTGTLTIDMFSFTGDLSNLHIYNNIQEVYSNSQIVTSSSNGSFITLMPGKNKLTVKSSVDADIDIRYYPQYF